MAKDDRKKEFDPDHVDSIGGSVLRYPFLKWVPTEKKYPTLTVRLPDGTSRDLSVRGILGSGAFGVVFLCVDGSEQLAVKLPSIHSRGALAGTDIGPRLARDLAIDPNDVDNTLARRQVERQQSLQAELAGSDLTQILQTFRNETEMLKRLDHPNIVEMLFSAEIVVGPPVSGVEYTLPCIAMPFVRGQRLSEIISDEESWNLRADFLTILETGRDLALALASIHDRKTCHRDLSWFNVMRSTDHRAVIIDLGNVALPEDPPTDQVLQTTGGGIVLPFVPFTPGFVAPEHRDGTCVIDGRGDQFSLGVLLYLWCSGKDAEGCLWPYNPDTGYANNPADPHRPIPLVELRASFLEDWPPLLRTSYAAFSHIVQRMLSRRREDRYSSLRDVAAEIQMILALHNPGAVAPLATAELQMDGSFLETCRQVSVAPSEEAGCLILQTLVRQGRQQIEQTIGRIWSDLFEIWFDSQWSFDQKLRRMLDEGRKLETVFHTSLNTVLRTFQATRLAGSAAPRFGGRLQQILGRPGSAPMPPRSVTGYDAKTVQERIDEQWNYFSRRQEELAEIDYLLALYSLQLRTTRTST